MNSDRTMQEIDVKRIIHVISIAHRITRKIVVNKTKTADTIAQANAYSAQVFVFKSFWVIGAIIPLACIRLDPILSPRRFVCKFLYLTGEMTDRTISE